MDWKASLPRLECKSRLEEVLLLTSSARAAPQTALEFEGKIFHMANSAEHYHQMVEKCVKVLFTILSKVRGHLILMKSRSVIN